MIEKWREGKDPENQRKKSEGKRKIRSIPSDAGEAGSMFKVMGKLKKIRTETGALELKSEKLLAWGLQLKLPEVNESGRDQQVLQ